MDQCGVPLRPDKGTPTVTYLTLRPMKMANGSFGGLKSVTMSTIQNFETLLQIEQLTDTGVLLDEAVKKKHSVQNAMTSIQQSGHKVLRVRAEIDPTETFRGPICISIWLLSPRTPPADSYQAAAHDPDCSSGGKLGSEREERQDQLPAVLQVP